MREIGNYDLAMDDRQRVEREASPIAAVADSQSVKTTESGGVWVTTLARVRPEGVHHLWRKVPSGELSI
jgi:hypothetical protein